MSNPLGLPSFKSVTFHSANVGDRQTTPAEKRRIKEEQDYKCARCGRKLPKEYLQVHHKRGIASHRNPYGNLPVYALGHKPKLSYERRSNKEALCIKCHNETKKKPKKRNPSLRDLF